MRSNSGFRSWRGPSSASSAQPYPAAREMLVRIAPVISAMPNRITISGHTSAGPGVEDPSASPWQLSADRAEVVRQILVREGVAGDRFAGIEGKADSDPLFVNDPALAANRRVTILLMEEDPPLPPDAMP